MKQLEQARILLTKAREDEQTVAVLLAHAEIGNSIIGFHCQQAVEKLLKSLLSVRRVVFRHSHNLAVLITALEQSGYSFPEDLRALETFTRFAVEFRYDLFDEHERDFDRHAAFDLVCRLRAMVESEMEKVAS